MQYSPRYPGILGQNTGLFARVALSSHRVGLSAGAFTYWGVKSEGIVGVGDRGQETIWLGARGPARSAGLLHPRGQAARLSANPVMQCFFMTSLVETQTTPG